MSHYAIVVDLDRCIGCHGCEIACKNENEVELGSFWNKVVQVGLIRMKCYRIWHISENLIVK